ncbi:hypothetical protein RSEGYP2_19 [Ralstonia phage RsoP1EGY]|uniref:Uncharacterized protein n=1 Tax=Ralstonia phage RsoP1EGY TaxID=2070026 RepID=A0A2R2ZGF6_9CAUD|nr:hypothetical protein HOT00_gp19 [Ralstonia phage RsoP1EGY]AUO78180.1 hypothetical protein RSEGYP2_19 [Ralstonia phage RsoP1EGY]
MWWSFTTSKERNWNTSERRSRERYRDRQDEMGAGFGKALRRTGDMGTCGTQKPRSLSQHIDCPTNSTRDKSRRG